MVKIEEQSLPCGAVALICIIYLQARQSASVTIRNDYPYLMCTRIIQVTWVIILWLVILIRKRGY